MYRLTSSSTNNDDVAISVCRPLSPPSLFPQYRVLQPRDNTLSLRTRKIPAIPFSLQFCSPLFFFSPRTELYYDLDEKARKRNNNQLDSNSFSSVYFQDIRGNWNYCDTRTRCSRGTKTFHPLPKLFLTWKTPRTLIIFGHTIRSDWSLKFHLLHGDLHFLDPFRQVTPTTR